MLVSVLPLWVVAFASLQVVAGTGGPPPAPKTLVEAAGQYDDISTPAWIAWVVFASGILVLTSFAVLWLGRSVRGLRAGPIAAGLGAAAMGYGLLDALVTTYMEIALKVSDPPSYAPLVERFALDLVNAKDWLTTLMVLLPVATIGVAAWALWRAGILGRTAPVLTVLAGVFAVLAVALPIPMLPAILLLVLGIALLRRRPETA
jgi:hypothetical protein